MVRARCIKFVEERGFGFLRPLDGGADIFVHVTKIPGEVPLREGELVDIETEASPRGPRAIFVQRVG